MTTERFSKQEFESALQNYQPESMGLVDGEYRYCVNVKVIKQDGLCSERPMDMKINVFIASSIGPSGYADGTGENSIRLWLGDESDKPLGNKISRWVTRVPGWEKRMLESLEKLIAMGKRVEYCTKCHQVEKVFIVHKIGPNKGRIFKRCNCNKYTYFDEFDQEPENGRKTADPAPKCPKCGSPMRKRNGKFGEFWGCSIYPACNGTMNLADFRPEPEPIRDGKVWKDPVEKRLEEKAEFAKREAEQERAAFESKWLRDRTYLGPGTPQELLDQKVSDAREKQAKKATKREALAAKAIASLGETPPVIEKGERVYSHYQNAIFDWGTNGGGNAVAEACAGSGKTTTGAELARRMPKVEDAVFVVFNAHNVKPMADKLPKYIKARTYHSLGLAACRAEYPNCEIDDKGDKVENLLERVLDKYTNRHLYSPIKQLVSLVKGTLTDPNPAGLQGLADYHGIEMNGDADTIFAATQLVIEMSADQTSLIDFDDMCWLPVYKDLPTKKYNFLAIDEAQDTNRCQLELALRSVADFGRVIAFGDRYQSMYGFRGADVDAIPNLIEGLEAMTLPLSISYRCPLAVVDLVNKTFPEIPFEPFEHAKDGLVRSISEERALMEYRPDDMVLCRTNAPLVKPAFDLIRRGVKAIIRGHEIGKGLNALIRKMRASNLIDLLRALDTYQQNECAKLFAAGKTAQIQSITDKVETIVALAEGCNVIAEIEDKIDTIFSDKNSGVVFSTVHRAKGNEAERVFILRPELMPHPMASKEWEQVQERNIKYVAYTRALSELVFVQTSGG